MAPFERRSPRSEENPEPSQPIVLSERGSKMKARSIVIWFSRPIAPSVLTAAPHIRVAEHSSLGQPGLYTKPVVPCARFSCLLVIAQSRPRKRTSMATVTPSGGWYP
jgi:hypothetical protein